MIPLELLRVGGRGVWSLLERCSGISRQGEPEVRDVRVLVMLASGVKSRAGVDWLAISVEVGC